MTQFSGGSKITDYLMCQQLPLKNGITSILTMYQLSDIKSILLLQEGFGQLAIHFWPFRKAALEKK